MKKETAARQKGRSGGFYVPGSREGQKKSTVRNGVLFRYGTGSAYSCFQVVREIRAIIGKISRRPASMSKIRTSLDRTLRLP